MRRIALLLGSLVAALAAAGSPAASAAELRTLNLPSRHVDPARVQLATGVRGLNANVLLPDGYTPARRWPVLYVLHGHGGGYHDWAKPDVGDVPRIARGLPAIVVMPEGGVGGWYANWWNGGRRAGPAWERYFLEEVIPFVERRFPIRAERRWHAIVGNSMGGEGAMVLAARRPGYFGSAAAFSGILSIQRAEWPSLMDTQGERHVDVFGDPEAQRFYWEGYNPLALVGNLRHTRLLTAVGDGIQRPHDTAPITGALAEGVIRQHNEDFAAAARAAGLDLSYRPREGIHDWLYWRADLAAMLRWDPFVDVPERPTSWEYRTVAAKGDAWGWRFEFQRRAPEETVTFRRRGQVLSGRGPAGARVVLKPPRGRIFAVRLPFDRPIPDGL